MLRREMASKNQMIDILSSASKCAAGGSSAQQHATNRTCLMAAWRAVPCSGGKGRDGRETIA
jgi:hypothetical protein